MAPLDDVICPRHRPARHLATGRTMWFRTI